MDVLDLISKLNLVLASAKFDADLFMNSSDLPLDERFEASRTVEVTSLRNGIEGIISDLKALDEIGE